MVGWWRRAAAADAVGWGGGRGSVRWRWLASSLTRAWTYGPLRRRSLRQPAGRGASRQWRGARAANLRLRRRVGNTIRNGAPYNMMMGAQWPPAGVGAAGVARRGPSPVGGGHHRRWAAASGTRGRIGGAGGRDCGRSSAATAGGTITPVAAAAASAAVGGSGGNRPTRYRLSALFRDWWGLDAHGICKGPQPACGRPPGRPRRCR